MELKSYITQSDIYSLMRSEVQNIHSVSNYSINEFHIVHQESPTSQVSYPYPNKEDMDFDYSIIIDLINKLK